MDEQSELVHGLVIDIEKPTQWRSRYSPFLKTFSAVIMFAFLLQDFSHAQGGTPVWSHVTETKEINPKDPSRLNNITIPYESGLTRKVVAKGTDDVIINIQDAHSKLGAQESITRILDNLVKNYNLNLIALEGATDVVDTSLISSFPIEEVKQKTGE